MDLSIIIPTYNRNSSVVECVLALDHNQAEIVVVDDGSTEPVVLPPGTGRVIRHDSHRGRPAAVNTGLKAAAHDLIMVIDDDVYAAPDMVIRLVDQFIAENNPMLALTPRVVWDPDLPPTLTMQWLEEARKLATPILFWRPFVLNHGGYDENVTGGLDEAELQLRLKPHGLEVRLNDTAAGFKNKVVKIRDLVETEFTAGASAVYLHSKFPSFLPQADDMDLLARNRKQTPDAEAAIEEIALLEQAESKRIPSGAADLFAHVCRHYFLVGVQERLQELGAGKAARTDNNTLAIYHEASRLENMGEYDEARRLFHLVLLRSQGDFRDGAEFHLGRIETRLGNEDAARLHFTECLQHNPAHIEARRALNHSAHYREVAANVFEAEEPGITPKVLFILFGGVTEVINAFPVVAALRDKFLSQVTWLTLAEHSALSAAGAADKVREAEQPGTIPWDWIQSEGFTHVFYPEAGVNRDEWQHSGLHAIDFMALKCGVELETRRAAFSPSADAVCQAEEFLRRHSLSRKCFITASQAAGPGRRWPHSNLTKLAERMEIPIVVFCDPTDAELPGTIAYFDKSPEVIAALIESSSLYIGSESGTSWLATTTDTPMAVFLDPVRQAQLNVGFRDVLHGEKNNIKEFSIFTNFQTVTAYIKGCAIPGEADFAAQAQ